MSAEFTPGILVIEDDASSRALLVAALKADYGQVLQADTADLALSIFQREQPLIVLTDINLPGISGVELTRRFTNANPNALIGVITGDAQEKLVIDCLKAGASDFLTKPVAKKELLEMVKRFASKIGREQSRLMSSDVLESAKIELTLHTSHRAIIPSVDLLVDLVKGFIDEAECARMELALNEVIRNAYEHGNLGITLSEKSTVCEAESLEALLKLRSAEARKMGKMIRIRAEVGNGLLTVSIEDEGDGFNWQKMVSDREGQLPESVKMPNGRGLLLVRRVFDKMEFNEKGNLVTLTKRL